MTYKWTPISKTIVSKADLVRLGPDAEKLAYTLGYKKNYKPKSPNTKQPVKETFSHRKDPSLSSPKFQYEYKKNALTPLPFWTPTRYNKHTETEDTQEQISATTEHKYPESNNSQNTPKPSMPLLCNWRVLSIRLKKFLSQGRTTRALNIEKIVNQVSSGEVVYQLPYKKTLSWPNRLTLILDPSLRLTPYYQDQAYVIDRLNRELPSQSLDLRVFSESKGKVITVNKRQKTQYNAALQAEKTVLVLGDLAQLSRNRKQEQKYWIDLGRQIKASGKRPIVLFPGHPDRCSKEIQAIWTIVPWETPGNSENFPKQFQRLIGATAIATRLEPGLLRSMRKIFDDKGIDCSCEADVWGSKYLSSQAAAGATLKKEHRNALQEHFEKTEPADIQYKAIAIIEQWRRHLPEDIWYFELLNSNPIIKEHLSEETKRARAYFHACYHELKPQVDSGLSCHDRTWLSYVNETASDHFWEDQQCGAEMTELTFRALRNNANYTPPSSFTPSMLVDKNQKTKRIYLSQSGHHIVFSTSPLSTPSSPLCYIQSKNNVIKVKSAPSIDDFWTNSPPEFVNNWGIDEYGPWATIDIQNIEIKLRWIPPGSFFQGSPDHEVGRRRSEGPQSYIDVEKGFWLAETPTTQKLWTAVKGNNPSDFKCPDRPVEMVSWYSAKDFMVRISNNHIKANFPSETQWEYACRAGTQTQTYLEDIDFLDPIRSPSLDAIAWYKGNSYQDFDLQAGVNTTSWPEKQVQAGTRKVGQKQPNGFGLYDMLGNVWEMCADNFTINYNVEKKQKQKRIERVLRGGSWISFARFTRSACRSKITPNRETYTVGFRCIFELFNENTHQLCEPKNNLNSPHRSTNPLPKTPSKIFQLNQQEELPIKTLGDKRFTIISDTETINLQHQSKPKWASAIGRDKFGLWASFKIQDVTQILRWIPPGTFWMGNPDSERNIQHYGRYQRTSEFPRHEVTISTGFWIFDTPITQALWQAVMGKNPSQFSGENNPVETLSWNDGASFFKKLNLFFSVNDFNFPSEAQWEYACRADEEKISRDQLDEFAWYQGSPQLAKDTTMPVKLKKPNAFGLYDILGNVFEWCEDSWHRNYEGAPNTGEANLKATRDTKVIRGGSWGSAHKYVGYSQRSKFATNSKGGGVGLRGIALSNTSPVKNDEH